MSFIRYLFLGLLAFVLIVLALANRSVVTLRLLPEDLGLSLGYGQGVTLPLFVVIFLAIALGLLIGFVWEWLREHKHRAEARTQRAQKERLEKELAKQQAVSEPDEVLALLDTPR
ncbi:LapA family protein [Jannaschia sp. M317]|uniref:LapA family protein n=1 Tax=Jannaschia sp. M317 TaxID=2867011 RepID=UPI0021A42C20|nr:LapA family protein [Jannaschia sp. M317]UWQ17628.1 LapA family protein [Jannaschia sp. M317]